MTKVLELSHLYPVSYNHRIGMAIHLPMRAMGKLDCEVRMVTPIPWSPFPINRITKDWKSYSEVPVLGRIDNVAVYYPRYLLFPKDIFKPLSGYLMYIGIKKLIENIYTGFPFEIIHAHMAIPDGQAAVLLAKKFRKPLVVTVRGTDINYTAKRSKSCFMALQNVLKEANIVIVPNPRIKKGVDDMFGVISTTICNGIDMESVLYPDMNECLRNKYASKTIILSVSDLIPLKAIDYNIKAIHALIKKHNNLLYIIVGDGPIRMELEKLVKTLHLSDYVEFVGAKSHAEAMMYMSTCDIYCMPSWQETFGLSYLEAMAHGKPVIGCRGQGMDSLLLQDRCGLLAEPKNIESLVSVLNYLIENPEEAKAMGNRGFDIVRSKYTHESNAKQLLSVYQHVLQHDGINKKCH